MTPGSLAVIGNRAKTAARTSTDQPPQPWGGWPVVRPVSRWRIWVWGVAYWLVLAPWTWMPPRLSGNVFSRYMTIEAIVERGTLAIERSPLLERSGSPDMVRFGPHLYSDKPPVLPAIASPIYAVLRIFGIRFGGPVDQFLASNFALTWGVVGLASALTLVALRAMLQGVAIPPWLADLATLAFGFGSPLLTYAVTFNNHSVAAGCVTGAWALTILERPKSRTPGRSRFLSGMLAGLGATIDLPVGGLTAACLAMIHLVRGRRRCWTYFAGVLGPTLLHSILQSAIAGTPLPAEMYPSAFEYPGSYWTTPEGIWKETGPRWQFGLDLLVGRQGAFTVFPALWFGLVGMIGGMIARRFDRPTAWMVAGSLAILIGYYVWGVRRTDFAGASFGVRHLLAITPMVYLFALLGLSKTPSFRWVACGLFVAAMAVGGIYAAKGMINPWSRVETRAETDPTLRAVQQGALYRGGTFRGDTRRPQPGAGVGR